MGGERGVIPLGGGGERRYHQRPPGVEADTGEGPAETGPPPGQPWLKFEITGAQFLKYAAAPTLSFAVDINDESGCEIFMASLTVQIQTEPKKRSYTPEERERLTELFGDPKKWGQSAQRLQLSAEKVLLRPFTGTTSVDVEMLCNYDLELAAAKYFHAVDGGTVPMVFHWNGTVYYTDSEDKLQMVQIPWDTVSDHQLDIDVWKRMMDHYYPHRGWVPVQSETLEALRKLKTERGLMTFDDTVRYLIGEAGGEAASATLQSRPGPVTPPDPGPGEAPPKLSPVKVPGSGTEAGGDTARTGANGAESSVRTDQES
ncbi:MAG: DUF6084 family protein [Actinomycetota bacterium]|nr:DUF6084 family protein [Actinomycetota bacterium]